MSTPSENQPFCAAPEWAFLNLILCCYGNGFSKKMLLSNTTFKNMLLNKHILHCVLLKIYTYTKILLLDDIKSAC
jgi:hypothetical protein